jgi:hypothetical protein
VQKIARFFIIAHQSGAGIFLKNQALSPALVCMKKSRALFFAERRNEEKRKGEVKVSAKKIK